MQRSCGTALPCESSLRARRSQSGGLFGAKNIARHHHDVEKSHGLEYVRSDSRDVVAFAVCESAEDMIFIIMDSHRRDGLMCGI